MANKTNSKASVLYAIISNTIVLVLIGLFLLLYFHTNSITSILKERINIIVELSDDSDRNAVNSLGKKIASWQEVKPRSVDLIPKSDAPKLLGEDIGVGLDIENSPFKDVIVFNVKSSYYNEDNLEELKTRLSSESIVEDVIYKNLIIDNIKSNLNKLSLVIFIINIFFLILVVVIMYNTINLSLYADRWEIKTMEIIGARDRFIRQPYLKIAGRIALTSFVISGLFILMFVGIMYFNSDFVANVLSFGYLFLTLIIILVLSLCITIIATIRIVNSYLYREEGELY